MSVLLACLAIITGSTVSPKVIAACRARDNVAQVTRRPPAFAVNSRSVGMLPSTVSAVLESE